MLARCVPLGPSDRALALEDDEALEAAYNEVAIRGDTEAPANPEEEVDYHYVCFVKSHKDGHLYELDGDRKGPVDLGSLEQDDDLLSGATLTTIRHFVQKVQLGMGFSLLALAPQ